jgi:hypothetical protein
MGAGRSGARRRARTQAIDLEAAPGLVPEAASPAEHVHDLAAMRARLCRLHFDGDIDVPVLWGRAARGRWSMTFGSYDFERRIVRVHPRLDHLDVPAFFVEAVIFHELLHHVLGFERQNGRRVMHSTRFRELEARYEHFQLARQWQKENLQRLLGRRTQARRRPPGLQPLSLF